jgi:lycopene elongase/hydratase (dihydrobisanhydrobacterioruberin-forming)
VNSRPEVAAGKEEWRTLNRARRAGYALLPGDGFSYLLHLRPGEWPIMAAHTALGFVLAAGVTASFSSVLLPTLAAALAVWVIFLNGGTLAINSAYDRDEGDVGYLDAPPPPPRALAPFSIALMAIGQLLAFTLGTRFAVAYAVCFAMSLLYSVPPVRLKAVAGADWVINLVGFGIITPYAGWVATGLPVTQQGWWILVAFGPLFAALYPLTQIYQCREDAARGDRTLVLAMGVRWSLAAAIVATIVAFACFARAATLGDTSLAGAAALVGALVIWLLLLAGWLVRAPHMTDAMHKRGMYLALGAWAATDAAVLLAFARW